MIQVVKKIYSYITENLCSNFLKVGYHFIFIFVFF